MNFSVYQTHPSRDRILNSYVRNCVIKARNGESLFDSPQAVVRLDGYAIVPREEYESLRDMIAAANGITVEEIEDKISQINRIERELEAKGVVIEHLPYAKGWKRKAL